MLFGMLLYVKIFMNICSHGSVTECVEVRIKGVGVVYRSVRGRNWRRADVAKECTQTAERKGEC